MKGILKGSDGTVFNLLPKITTIGRHDCSLAIQSGSADSQHAVIEYNGRKDCFVLQDLDTSLGTSINRCLVRNAAVCLQPGDVLKFGDHPVTYEFGTTNECPHVRPPSYPRPAWTSSSTNFTESASVLCGPSRGLPKSGSLQRLNMTTGNYPKPSISPHPPTSAKMRSVENGVRRNSLDLPLHAAPDQDSNDTRLLQTPDGKNGSHFEQLQRHLKILMEELKLLAGIEMNSRRKDELINQLNSEISVLQRRLLQNESSSTDLSEVKQKLTHLEKEMVREKMETSSLKSQLSQMKPVVPATTSPYHAKCTNSAASSNLVSKSQLKTKPRPQPSVFVESESTDAKTLITEIEYLRKDKNITLGLLTQIQKEAANKDVSISHLMKQISELKKEILVKDTHVASLKSKMPFSDSSKTDKEALELKDREIVLLQYKLKLSDNQRLELSDQLVSTKKNLSAAQTSYDAAKQKLERAESEVETLKSKSKDLEQADHLVRAAMEQISKRLEFLRNGVVKIVFGCAAAAPDDDKILSALSKFSDHLTDLQKCNKELTSKCEIENAVAEVARKLEEELKSTWSTLKDKDRAMHDLQSEIGRIGALQIADSSLSGIRDAFILHLQMMLEREKNMENATVQSKSNAELRSRLEEAQTEIASLKLQLTQAKEHNVERMEEEFNQRLVDLENMYKEEIGRITHEGGLKLMQVVNDAQKVSQDAMENALKVERQRSEEMEQLVTLLRQNLKESEDKFELMKTQAQNTAESLEASRNIETDLKADLEHLKSKHAIEVEKFTKSSQELNRKLEEMKKEREQLMDRIESHASTLCTLEECLDMAVKKNKEHQIENCRLENIIADLENGRRQTVIPPAPAPAILQPVVDELAMEQLVRDNIELDRKVSEQQNAIMALRRDLAGATARLSDVTAELSEAQKVALEKGNRKIQEQEKELVRLQRRITQMSKVIDKQTDEVKELKENIRKEKELVAQCREEISKQKTESDLLKLAKEELERKTAEESKENVRNELHSLGAQCRGDRHLQTIERQREALAELRERLKTLTGFSAENQPPTTFDEALQHLITLQKEFEILKANQPPPSADAKEEKPTSQQSTDCAAASHTRSIDFASKAQLDMEKSAHYETQKCLDYSEQSYLALVRAVSEALDLDFESCLKSIAHLSLEESELLTAERKSDQEKILSHVNAMKKRVERKDDLVDGYERNLSRVREVEDLAVYKDEKAESLSDEIKILKEEIDRLQNALNRMREQLDREKRLNASIKQKKTFHLENGFSLKDGWPKHHCLREGIAKEKKSRDEEALEQEDTKLQSMEGDSDFKLIAVDT